MAKYNVADAFSIEAGPQIGFLMSAQFASVDVKAKRAIAKIHAVNTCITVISNCFFFFLSLFLRNL